MEKKVKVGIIGLGFMGTTHLDIYRNNPKAEIVAIADVNADKLKGDISSVVGNISGGDNRRPLDLDGVSLYKDGFELIKDPAVEIVDICVPVFLHKKFATAALEFNKHVICEKPLAKNSAEAEDIIVAAKKSQGFLLVGMCIRFWPEYVHAKDLIKSGELGKVRSASLKRLSPSVDGNSWENWFMDSELSGGAVYDLHLHDSDAVRWMFGMPKSVSSFGAIGVKSHNGVDHVVTRYDMGDGSLVTAEGGWDAAKNTPFEMSFQIVCDKGTIRFSETGYKVIYETGEVETPSPAKENLPTGWHAEIDYMLDCVLFGKPPYDLVPLDEILESIKIVEAEMRSIKENAEVAL
jgi:predicted dehydrogenase